MKANEGAIGFFKALRPRRVVRRRLMVVAFALITCGLLAEVVYAIGELCGCFPG